MALQKTKTYDNGFSSEYHKISSISVNFTRKQFYVDLFSYKDQATRDANKSEVERRGYSFVFPENVEEIDRPTVYSLLKALPEFEGATDV